MFMPMKSIFGTIAFFLLALVDSWAHPIAVIDIVTKKDSVVYFWVGKEKPLKEIEEAVAQLKKSYGPREMEDLYVRPDDATSFKTVIAVIQKMQAVGAKNIHVSTVADANEPQSSVFLTVGAKSIQLGKDFYEKQEKKK